MFGFNFWVFNLVMRSSFFRKFSTSSSMLFCLAASSEELGERLWVVSLRFSCSTGNCFETFFFLFRRFFFAEWERAFPSCSTVVPLGELCCCWLFFSPSMIRHKVSVSYSHSLGLLDYCCFYWPSKVLYFPFSYACCCCYLLFFFFLPFPPWSC